ncbi:MAG: acyltransferase domain-containing protein [Burkholderiales bacterium]|nr:acyltransferase domain-containing protein [Burkholderiales bacterium]
MERDVAIIGMACVFPRAPDLTSFWRNIEAGVDAITDVPAQRWDPVYYDPTSAAPDRVYARRGGFIDEFARFDAGKFGIMPAAAKATEPEQLLTLQVAADALADAGYAERAFARATTSVVVGRGHYFGPRMVRMLDVTRGTQQLVESLRALLPDLGEGQIEAIRKDFQARCGTYNADAAIGLVPNLLASRVANRLDLGGSAYTIDAACASALLAVDLAVRELREGRSDLVLAGGVHLCHDIAFWSVFSQLGALSRRQQIRPFDRAADGLLIGEGIGMFVLKRVADARRDDDRIYAVIRGTGTSSDGRDTGLMAPGVEGQVLALTRAWRDAALDPATVGLVEAHGTATAAGDAAELTTLARIFGEATGERVPLGSVKSMIGHTMPAAGAAGLVKATLAVYHGTLPPTLHCDDPHPLLARTRFRALATAQPWDAALRRAAVNAFGFGGINAHVIVDAPEAPRRSARRGPAGHDGHGALVAAAPTCADLAAAVAAGVSGGEGRCRVALIAPTARRVESAVQAIQAGRPRRGRDGLYFSPEGLAAGGGKVAFLYPGVEAAFAPKVADIARHFDLPAPEVESPNLEQQGFQVFALNAFLTDVLAALGVRPDLIAGHSIGEWSGMLAAGMFERESLRDLIASLRPGMLRVADLEYLAVGAGAARVGELVAGIPGMVITHDNCVHQSIVCGPPAAVARARERLREARILFELLPFRSGFHSPALAPHLDFYSGALATVALRAPERPLWSATTCAPYPADPRAIAQLFLDHLVQPVRFRETILALYAAGARVFVQVGTGSLTAFVDDVLAGQPHHAISVVSAQHPGMDQLRRACAALYVEGAPVDLARVGLAAKGSRPVARGTVALELGAPLIRVEVPPLRSALAPPTVTPAAAGHRVAAAFDESMRELAAAHAAVVAAFTQRRPGPQPGRAARAAVAEAPTTRTDRLELSLATYPELIDHSLVPQPPGWREPIDRAPTVPMTMSIALLRDAAQRLDPARTPVVVEDVLASSWLYVEPAVTVDVVATRLDAHRIRVKIEGYVEGTVTMAERYPAAPTPSAEPLADAQPFPVPMDRIYRDGWLFHGPQYQGVVALRDHGAGGLRGTLIALPGKGALLDAAGQVYGLWVVASADEDRLAMPVRIDRVEFFSPDPAPGTSIECTVRSRRFGRREVRADLELVQGDHVYCRITGWEDWRFETAGGIYEVIRQPSEYLLATFDEHGVAMLTDPGWRSVTIDFLARRFNSKRELDASGGIKKLQRERQWLLGRIAAKDAVRRLVRERGGAHLFPIEVAIDTGPNGEPLVGVPSGADVRVSIAHKDAIGVALAAEGVTPGIDIEKIEARGEGFAGIAFSPAELVLVTGGDRDETLTRLWAAKEAAGKAAGTGLAHAPKRFVVEALDGERVRVNGRWIATRRHSDYIIAWTPL